MPSLQNSAGAGKAAKFVSADPLAPMANPFDGLVSSQFQTQHRLPTVVCHGGVVWKPVPSRVIA